MAKVMSILVSTIAYIIEPILVTYFAFFISDASVFDGKKTVSFIGILAVFAFNIL